MKNKGSSLLYTFIILSVLCVFLTGFIFFTKNRYQLLKFNSVYSYNLKERLIENEEIFSASLYRSGIFTPGNKIMFTSRYEYYNSGITEDNPDETAIKRLIYFKQNKKGTGGFNITAIQDQNNNIYNLPLKENTLYPDLTITYEKNILNINISVMENIKFFRKNNDEITIETGSLYFKGE